MRPTTGPSYATPAWVLRGIQNEPGILSLYEGRWRLELDDGVLFDVPVERIEKLSFPWYQMSAGFHATVDGRRHRISLIRPDGARIAMRWYAAHTQELHGVWNAYSDIPYGRRTGKQWRALLGA